jgi:hypothetical protein
MLCRCPATVSRSDLSPTWGREKKGKGRGEQGVQRLVFSWPSKDTPTRRLSLSEVDLERHHRSPQPQAKRLVEEVREPHRAWVLGRPSTGAYTREPPTRHAGQSPQSATDDIHPNDVPKLLTRVPFDLDDKM